MQRLNSELRLGVAQRSTADTMLRPNISRATSRVIRETGRQFIEIYRNSYRDLVETQQCCVSTTTIN